MNGHYLDEFTPFSKAQDTYGKGSTRILKGGALRTQANVVYAAVEVPMVFWRAPREALKAKASPTIIAWKTDKPRFRLTPYMSDGRPGHRPLHGLFQSYHDQVNSNQ